MNGDKSQLGRRVEALSMMNQVRAEIAVVLSSDTVGGHEHMLLKWLGDAQSAGLKPYVHCIPGSEMDSTAQRLGFSTLPLGSTGENSAKQSYIKKLQKFKNLWRAIKSIDKRMTLLLAPGAMQASPLLALACTLQMRRLVVYLPMVQTSQAIGMRHPRLRDFFTRYLAKRISFWIVIDRKSEEALKQHWNISAPMVRIPNRYVDLNFSAFEKQPSKTLKVLFLGRFDPNQKGLDWLLAVLRKNASELKDISFVFQGKGWFEGELRKFADEFPLLVSVASWGSTKDALATADVLLLTSRFEGFPLVGVEAIGANVPVVATFTSGLEEIIPVEDMFAFGDEFEMLKILETMRDVSKRINALNFSKNRLSEVVSEEKYRAGVMLVVDKIAGFQISSSKN